MPKSNNSSNTVCNICETKMIGSFCHGCGQQDTKRRLTFLVLIKDFIANILTLERSGISTMIHLIKDPKKVIESYWEGKRRYFQPPSRLLVYASVVLGLHSYWHDNLIIGLAFSDNPQLGFLTIFLILFPLSSFIAYTKKRRNLTEHLVANFYLFSLWSIIIVVAYDLCFLIVGKEINLSWTMLVALVIAMLAYDSKVFSTSKSIQHKVLSSLFQFILLVAVLLSLIGLTLLTGQAEINF